MVTNLVFNTREEIHNIWYSTADITSAIIGIFSISYDSLYWWLVAMGHLTLISF